MRNITTPNLRRRNIPMEHTVAQMQRKAETPWPHMSLAEKKEKKVERHSNPARAVMRPT
jgi:hypothetical protein